MTYAAAREAGFSSYNAGQLALYAQCVDESMGTRRGKEGYRYTRLKEVVPYEKNVGLQMTQHWVMDERQRDIAGGGGKAVGRTSDMMILMAFHFLPGMQSPSEVKTGIPIIDNTVKQYTLSSKDRLDTLRVERDAYEQSGNRRKVAAHDIKISRTARRMVDRATGTETKTDRKENLITWPSSVSSTLMMLDTLNKVDAECRNDMKGNVINALYLWRGTNLRDPRIVVLRDIVRDKRINISVKDFLLALVGVRIHTYADTFAHQGFSGARSGRINNAINRRYRPHCTIPNYTGVYDGVSLGEKLQTARIKYITKNPKQLYWLVTPFGTGSVGHGALGAWPDYPNCIYKYTRQRDSKTIERHNPPIYYQAYLHMKKELEQLPDMLKTNSRVGEGRAVKGSIIWEDFFRNNREYWWEKQRGAEWLEKIYQWDREARLALTKNILDGDHENPQALKRMSLPQRHAFSLASSYQLFWLNKAIKDRLGYSTPQAFLDDALTGDKEGLRGGTS
jgi:hypothetical protein